MSTEQIRDLVDEEGENLAVRTFLMLYGGGTNQPTTKQMRRHLDMSGFRGCTPEWAKEDMGLTKAGAQLWLRFLFDLEKKIEAPKNPFDAENKEQAS